MSHPILIPDQEIRLANWAQAIKRSALQEMLMLASRPGILSFALGLPAPELFPRAAFEQAASRVLESDVRALQYGPPFQPLKTHIIELMALRGVECREEQIFLTAGAQQGMNLLARLLLNPGGQIMIGDVNYTGFQQVIEPFQPQILAVPTDRQTGIDVDAVETILERGARPAFIYTITDGHNPLGLSLSMDKRIRLVELARTYEVPIVEDDAYGFLYYGDSSIPPMRALSEQWVLYAGSFSKILAPALRTGWLIVPENLISKLSIIKEASDIDTSTFTQRVISAYLDTGQFHEHIGMLRREYRERRNRMIEALTRYFPSQSRWQEPTNGLFIWVELPERVNATELLKAAIEQEQIAFVPGIAFCTDDNRPAVNCLRLNFSNCEPERIEEGIKRLASLIDRM